ncbi:hypothetical protein DPX39_000067600 [Trypanosoma brucei equiperdum]|uniref:Uncharacterized protein n=1 Tax=Trypanosoma brucei equiperdum TaxID=630700 RepID=A0A3L6KQU5_9TRYP|nr:hypothetical protein DPX39_000067600 [Trypanosoma brucei equiperdum]
MFATLGSWPRGIHVFLNETTKRSVEPWYLGYEERRRLTRDPRVVRQLELEDEWKDTCLEGVWMGFRRFARPLNDFKITEACFHEYLSFVGISNEYLRNRITSLFRLENSAEIDCLRVCKVLFTGLTEESTSSKFLDHCFRCIPSNPVSGDVEVDIVKKACEAQHTITDKKFPTELRIQQLEGVLRYFNEAEEPNFNLETFKDLFFHPDWCLWASSFIKCIYEAAAKYFSAPNGILPPVPLRWIKAAEPLPFDRNDIYDADALLLRNVEILGRENGDVKKRRKSPGKARSSKRRS